MKHDLHRPGDHGHTDYELEGHCMICDGGLGICKVCGLAECELDETPECPGSKEAGVKIRNAHDKAPQP